MQWLSSEIKLRHLLCQMNYIVAWNDIPSDRNSAGMGIKSWDSAE